MTVLKRWMARANPHLQSTNFSERYLLKPALSDSLHMVRSATETGILTNLGHGLPIESHISVTQKDCL